MYLVTAAIVPILLLLALGALLRRRFLTKDAVWAGLSWMSYWVFTPALFITSIGEADLSVVPPGPLLLSLAAPILGIAALTLALGRLARANGPQLTSLVQGAIRVNTYIGLIFASALHGEAGVATFALASAIVVPLVNLVCVTTLSVHGEKQLASGRSPLRHHLAGNPLILGCAIGLLLNVLPVPVPEFLQATLHMLAAPALACGTLIAGGSLRFAFQRRDLLDISIVTLLKLAVLPLSAMGIAVSLDVSGAALTSIVLICAVPTAPSASVLAARMGGDIRLIATITGAQTLLAAASMPVMLAIADRLAS